MKFGLYRWGRWGWSLTTSRISMRERRRRLLAAGLLRDTSFNLTRITMRFSQGKEKSSSCGESYPVDLAVGVLIYFIYHWFFCPPLLFFSPILSVSDLFWVYLFTKLISSGLRYETIRIWITLLPKVRERKKRGWQTWQDCFARGLSLKWNDMGSAKDEIVHRYYNTTSYMYNLSALLWIRMIRHLTLILSLTDVDIGEIMWWGFILISEEFSWCSSQTDSGQGPVTLWSWGSYG